MTPPSGQPEGVFNEQMKHGVVLVVAIPQLRACVPPPIPHILTSMVKWLFALAVAFLYVGTTMPVFAGFGITPPYVRNDRLTQGSSFTQEIILVRGDPVEDLKAELSFNVPGVDAWFVVDRGNTFLLPKGETQVPIKITVRVPEDAPYERHQGTIRVRTMSPEAQSGVSIALGAQIDVDIRVVDEIHDFEVKRVRIGEVEEPRRTLWLEFPGKITFTMGIENTGNSPTAPARVQLDIYDKRGNIVLESSYNTNAIDTVLPFETRDVVAYLPTRLPPGAYLVKYSIFKYTDEVKRSGELTLSILPAGSLSAYVGYGLEGLSLGDQLSLAIPVALLLLTLIGFAIYMQYRKSGRKHRTHPPHDHGNSIKNDIDYHHASAQHAPPVAPPRAPIQHGGVVDLSRGRRTK